MNKTYKEVEGQSYYGISPKYDIFVAELATEKGEFIFRYNKNPGFHGKCDQCFATGMMKVLCACKKVAYCNEKCR